MRFNKQYFVDSLEIFDMIFLILLQRGCLLKMPIRASFIVSSWYYWINPIKQQPLTQLYLATLLDENADVDVGLIDLRGNPNIEIPERDIYFYTIISPDFQELIDLNAQIRNKYPAAVHVAGGIHASFYPHEVKRYFDSVVIGDGEEIFNIILEDYKKGSLLPIYKNSSKKFQTMPKRHFIPKERVISSLFKSRPEIRATTAFFSKGCPFLCGFCANYEPHQLYRKTIDNIIAEIDYLKSEYSIEGIALVDDICIPLAENQADEYLKRVRHANIYWRGQTRAGVPQKILAKAREAGCLELAFGAESVSPEVLKIIDKRVEIATLKQTIKDCKDVGIWVQICLINGLPGEPENVVEITKEFINEVNPNSVVLCSLLVYPGSPFFINPKKYGITRIDMDYRKYQVVISRFKDIDTNRRNLNFRYENGFSEEQIIEHLLELQNFLTDEGYNK